MTTVQNADAVVAVQGPDHLVLEQALDCLRVVYRQVDDHIEQYPRTCDEWLYDVWHRLGAMCEDNPDTRQWHTERIK